MAEVLAFLMTPAGLGWLVALLGTVSGSVFAGVKWGSGSERRKRLAEAKRVDGEAAKAAAEATGTNVESLGKLLDILGINAKIKRLEEEAMRREAEMEALRIALRRETAARHADHLAFVTWSVRVLSAIEHYRAELTKLGVDTPEPPAPPASQSRP